MGQIKKIIMEAEDAGLDVSSYNSIDEIWADIQSSSRDLDKLLYEDRYV